MNIFSFFLIPHRHKLQCIGNKSTIFRHNRLCSLLLNIFCSFIMSLILWVLFSVLGNVESPLILFTIGICTLFNCLSVCNNYMRVFDR